MADFLTSLSKTLRNEGGWVNDLTDHGAETYKGVSRKFHPNWVGWKIIDEHRAGKGFPLILNKNELLQAAVNSFYKKEFWNVIRGDEITKQPIGDSVFDSSVNFGCHQAIILAQRAMKLPETGIMDDHTLQQLNA